MSLIIFQISSTDIFFSLWKTCFQVFITLKIKTFLMLGFVLRQVIISISILAQEPQGRDDSFYALWHSEWYGLGIKVGIKEVIS